MFCSLSHEQRLIGIVDQIIENGMRVHRFVGQFRTFVCMRIHPDGGTVDYDIVFLDNLGCNLLILDRVGTLITADEDGFQSQGFQTVVDGLRRTACTQDQGLLMPFLVEHGFDALCEPDDITVEAFQDSLVLLMSHPDDIHGSYGSGLRR